MEKEKWVSREDISMIDGVTYDQKQTNLLRAIAQLLIDIRTLLGQQEGNHGKTKNRY